MTKTTMARPKGRVTATSITKTTTRSMAGSTIKAMDNTRGSKVTATTTRGEIRLCRVWWALLTKTSGYYDAGQANAYGQEGYANDGRGGYEDDYYGDQYYGKYCSRSILMAQLLISFQTKVLLLASNPATDIRVTTARANAEGMILKKIPKPSAILP